MNTEQKSIEKEEIQQPTNQGAKQGEKEEKGATNQSSTTSESTTPSDQETAKSTLLGNQHSTSSTASSMVSEVKQAPIGSDAKLSEVAKPVVSLKESNPSVSGASSLNNMENPQQASMNTPSTSATTGAPAVSGGGSSSGWHVDARADVEPRRVVIQRIVKLLQSCKPKAFKDKEEKLIDLARRLEVALYKQSRTKEEYMDENTLRSRVRELAKASTQQQAVRAGDVARPVQPNHAATTRPSSFQTQTPSSHPQSVRMPSSTVDPSNNKKRSPASASDAEQKHQINRQRQQRLLLLKHASRCPAPEGTCKITPHCGPMKRLWKHIPTCRDQRCQVPHCVSSRYVLSHYHRCKFEDCPVCKPVRLMSRPNGRPAVAQSTSASQHNKIDPRNARNCVSGTGPSLPYSMPREKVEMHIRSLRVERLQMAVTPLLRKLIEHKHNKDVFNEPVDYVALNIPDYPKIIKNPMDLGTIRKRLEENHYRSLPQFQDDVFLVFKNAMQFNPPENEYHIRAHNLLKLAESEFPKIKSKLDRDGRKKGETCQLCRELKCETCPLCERGCIPFEPKVLFCSGPCTQRISRNATYYTGVGNNYCWCSDCYDKCKGGVLVVNNQQFNKRDLTKKKNNELYGEPWVSCDVCQRWMHQVCALFNSRKDSPESTQKYICPLCLIQESREGEAERAKDKNAANNKPELDDASSSSEAKPSASTKGKYKHIVLPAGKPVPGAEALPQTRLSVFLEGWIRDRIDKFQENEKANPKRKGYDPGPTSDKLHVRVMSNFDEYCKVKPFVKTLLPGYPDQFTFRSRCILLFQELDGVDVLFFAMFVQEYGSDCPSPNKRKLYIAYLDSVYYFRPRRMRTMVYHELLLAYLEYARRAGFTSAYIWACPPPNKRDDYIIHCHPEDQRVQTADRLRKWYHEMIKRGVRQNICLGSCALFEEHFESVSRPNSKKNSKGKKKKKTTKNAKSKNQKKGKKTKKGRRGTVTSIISTRSAPAATRATPAEPETAEPASQATQSSQQDENMADTTGLASPSMGLDEENDLLGGLPDLGDGNEDDLGDEDDEDDEAKDGTEKTEGAADMEVDAAAEMKPSIFVTPGNGLSAGDDKMLQEDMDRRKFTKLAINGRLPYFEGDYWPQEAEELAKERELKKKKEGALDDAGRSSRKRRRNGESTEDSGSDDKEGSSSSSADAEQKETKKDEQQLDMSEEEIDEARKQLIQRLSGQLDAMKDDFLVVKLAHECTRCGNYLLRGRWECRHTDCRSNAGFNKPCPFSLCNACYILERKRPKEQQHGGGCIADGPEGEPKDEAEEQMKNEGKDQERIDVNAEEKKKKNEDKEDAGQASEVKKSDDKQAETEEIKQQTDDDKLASSSTSTSATDAAPAADPPLQSSSSSSSSSSTSVPSAAVKDEPATSGVKPQEGPQEENEPGTKAKPSIDMTEDGTQMDVDEGKTPGSTGSSTSKESHSPSKTFDAPPQEETSSKKRPASEMEQDPAQDESATTKKQKMELTADSNEEKTEESKPEFPIKREVNIKLEKPQSATTESTTAAVEAKETDKAESKEEIEERKKKEEKERHEKELEEWKKQTLFSTRKVFENTSEHTLQYVDENLPVHTPDYDKIMKTHLLETRHAFLSLCTGNRYQFDQLRRAKHSTMMVLYHLHNPEAPAHLYTCYRCQKDILEGKRYHCDICAGGDFDLCELCNAASQHEHPLTAYAVTRGVNAETSEAQRLHRVTEMRRARKHSLALFLHALVHSSTCVDPSCKEAPCKKMKDLLKHRLNCAIRVRGGCEICRRVLCLVQMHAKNCKTKNCRVPHCEDLKAHIQSQLMMVRRRQLQQEQQGQGTRNKVKAVANGSSGSGASAAAAAAAAAAGGGGVSRRGRGGSIKGRQVKGRTTGPASAMASGLVGAGSGTGQPMQATVVEGSGGTRLKIRPALPKPPKAPSNASKSPGAASNASSASRRGRAKK